MKLRPLILLVMLMVSVLSSCATSGDFQLPATAEAEIYQYNGDLPIYPVIYEVMQDFIYPVIWEDAYLVTSDIYDDTYVIERGIVYDRSGYYSFTYSITEAAGTINFEISDIVPEIVLEGDEWTYSRSSPLYNPQILHNQFISKANQIMNDPNLYRVAKQAALSDGRFLRVIFDHMTDIQRDIFIENEFLGQTWTFAGAIIDIDEVDWKIRRKTATHSGINLPGNPV
jgi:hypothetical protein